MDRSNSSSTGFALAEEDAGPLPSKESVFAANPFLEWPVLFIGPPLVYTVVAPQSFVPSKEENSSGVPIPFQSPALALAFPCSAYWLLLAQEHKLFNFLKINIEQHGWSIGLNITSAKASPRVE